MENRAQHDFCQTKPADRSLRSEVPKSNKGGLTLAGLWHVSCNEDFIFLAEPRWCNDGKMIRFVTQLDNTQMICHV